MASKQTGRSILKWGCFGCLGCVGIVVMLVLVALGVGWLGARSAKIEDEVVARDLPAPASVIPPEASPAPAEAPESGDSTPRDSAAAGRVILDLAGADFRIRAGEPGGRVRVEASYDKSRYELEESFDQPAGEPWIYRVRFRKKPGGGWLRNLFVGSDVEVRLPPDVLLDLEIDVRQAGAEIDLGGLWLASAEVSSAQAGTDLSVSEPLRAPMERFELTARMGGTSVRSLGNASPAAARIDCSMGGMELDLRGEWVRDAAIEVKATMGGVQVHLPRGLPIRGVPGRDDLERAEPEIRLPTLTFTVDDSGGSAGIAFN